MTQMITRHVCPHFLSQRLFLLCAATYTIGLFGRFSYSSVMVALIESGSMNKAQAGLIGTALFIVYGLFQIFSGLIGDRVSPKKLVFTGVTGSAILNLGMGLTGSYGIMLALWSLNGVFQSFIWSPVARIFAEMLPPDQRKRAGSNAAATYPLGSVLVYLFASVLLSVMSWRGVFLISGVIMLAAGAFWYVCMSWFEQQIALSEEMETIELHHQKQQKKGGLLQLMVVSGVLFAAVSSMTHGMLRDGIQMWLPSLMTDNFHFGTSASVAFDIVLPFVNISGVFITKAIAKNHIKNELKGSAGFFAVTIAALSLLGFVCDRSAIASLLLLTVASTCMVGANIMLINLMPLRFGAIGRASSVTGILNCAAYVGSALSSYGIGAVADSFGWTSAIWAWVAFSLLAFLAALMGSGRWGRYERSVL